VPFYGETVEELFTHIVSDSVEWPDADDCEFEALMSNLFFQVLIFFGKKIFFAGLCPPEEAKDIITRLLVQIPFDRLGFGGAEEVKSHFFFEHIDWTR
jgi:hypothetical protein